jgi:membrane protease YdiL (CAAX protease family)
VAIVVLLLLVTGVERATTGRGPAAIGFDSKRIVRDTVWGVVLGAGLFTAVALELALTGHYRIVAVHATTALWFAALFVFLGAALEELLFRGVLFRIVDEWAGLWVALGVSAALFGLAHASNPGATWISSLAIAVEAGVLLGVAFAVTKNVWFPIGLHFAWNFCEGPIYGAHISGGTFFSSLVTAQIDGPAWLTGGAFGPEAGAPAVITCLIAALCLLKSRPASRKGGDG